MLFLDWKRPERLRMIEQAMKDKAPSLYRELRESNTLTSFLSDREEAMMESFEEAYAEAKSRILRKPNPDNAERLTMAQREAWEDTMTTWLEFTDDETP